MELLEDDNLDTLDALLAADVSFPQHLPIVQCGMEFQKKTPMGGN